MAWYWTLAFSFVVTALAVQTGYERLNPRRRAPYPLRFCKRQPQDVGIQKIRQTPVTVATGCGKSRRERASLLQYDLRPVGERDEIAYAYPGHRRQPTHA